ncbi:MAG: metallophosphoesterase family protein [Chlamydiia bacterium]|nr:metallophosphoesterase family protein [Chlamydiia bacterium]
MRVFRLTTPLQQKHFFSKLLFLLFFLLLFSIPLDGFESNRSPKIRFCYLTWQHDPCHTITLNVQGYKTPNELTVYYDTEPCDGKSSCYRYKTCGKEAQGQKILDGRKIYHIELQNLVAGTTYYFAIGNNHRCFGGEKKFRTLPDDGQPLAIIEGGDWEVTPEAECLAKIAAEKNPYAVFLGGDYPSYVFKLNDFKKWDAWLDVYTRRMVTPEGCLIPMVMTIGNHEVLGGFGQTKTEVLFFYEFFRQAEGDKTYFTLPFGPRIQLYVLDSGHAASINGEQKQWLAKVLEETKDIPIKLALYHVPLYPSLRFASKDIYYYSVYKIVELCHGHAADKLFSKESKLGRQHWLPLFDQYGMTVAFEHHDQALKRTKILKGGKEDPRGTLFLGDGGWGSEYQYHPIQGYFHSYFAMLKGKVHFFWLVEIEEETITYSAVTSEGVLIDHFVQFLRSKE